VLGLAVASAQAATIVWVSFHGADDEPSAGASGAGFTEAPDKGYTDLLTANGYNVTRYITTGSPDPAFLNAADLVIISRSVQSAHYQNASASLWNDISAPMIILSGYTLRSNRMGYTTGNTIPDITGDITLTVNNPTHPIFAGIPLTGGTMTNPYAGIAVYPNGIKYNDGSPVPAGTPAQGISINTDPVNINGTVLATISSAGNGPVGGMVIGEWPAGSTLTHAGGAGTDTLAGHRLVFLTGSREVSGIPGINSETAGMYDLYADGAQMFLNAVDYMLSAPAPLATNPSPANGAIDVPTDAVLTWTPGSGATSHHVYFGTNQADVAAGTGGTDKGTQTEASYNPGGLAYGTTYYWRVDEFDGTTTYPGNVWSFTTQGQGEGNILFEYFWGTDWSLESLLNLATFPDSPDQSELRTSFEGQINWRDNYGTHVRGYLYPPQTGNHTFWIASDDQSQLWLSTDEDPAHAVQIASVPGWTPSRDFDKTGEQRSIEITLAAGSRYYIEALHSEGGGGDNLAVAWQGPSIPTRAVISGTFLSPWITFKAANPSPGNGATDVPTDVALNWTPGSGAISHHIYFGTNQADVATGTLSTDMGTQPGTSYDPPGTLAYSTTYYWRIDELHGPTIYPGNIWSFTTTGIVAPPISIPTDTSVGTWDSVNRIYTLTQDVPQCMQVDEDNLILDGAGHSVIGPGSGNGVNLVGRTEVTIENLTVSQFDTGIYLEACSNCNLIGNTCNSNNGPGIGLDNSNGNTLTGNFCESNAWCGIAIYDSSNGNTLNNNTCNSSTDYDGIGLYLSTGNTLTANICESNKRSGIWLENSANNNTITNNSCRLNNGAGIDLWGSCNDNNLTGNTNNSNNVGIDLHACNNNTLEGNNSASNTWAGINLYYSNGNTLTGNTNNSHNVGICLDYSIGNTLNDNTCSSNSWAGIRLYSSENNTLTGNSTNSNNNGINLENSTGSTLTGNNSESNTGPGIELYNSSTGNNLTGNTCSSNSGNGIAIRESSNNTLTGNTCNSNNDNGISLYHSQDHNLTDNIAELNTWSGIYLDNSSGNKLTGNRVNLEFAGISLGESNNNTLSHNTCSSNSWAGIHLDNSTGNNLTGNVSESNTLFGIRLDNCSGNTIYNNNFISNPVQAYVDGGSGNIFNLNKPIGGNFWSDWTTPDADHNCFVDSPYIFTGGQDNLPWTRQDYWLSIDSDGVSDGIEDGAPNGGDGNSDTIPDSQQDNVASLLNAVDEEYVTIVSEVGTLENVSATADPPAPAPTGVEFPIGFLEFTVSGLAPGGSTTVTLLLPAGHTVGTYYKYGPTPDDPTNHWYEFLYDGTTGAEILSDRIILHFVDGQRGDEDLTANGKVVEPGAPAEIRVVGIDIKPGSYPNSFNNDGHGVIPVAILGSASFDVSQVDVSTVRLEGLALRVKGNGAYQFSIKDVSGNFSNTMQGEPDGYPDLVCQFVDEDSVWNQGESIAAVRGNLSDGAPFMGRDSIKITQ